jgi:hypothetical protein
VGVLYRNATGHGGVLCSGCHNSPHAIFASREPRDNQVMVDLQGHSGTLSACQVCHGIVPSGQGPHGIYSTAVEQVETVENEVLGGAARLVAYPSALRAGIACTIETPATNALRSRIVIFDASGRTVRFLSLEGRRGPVETTWDGRDARGVPVSSGAYFLRWDDGAKRAATKVVVVH